MDELKSWKGNLALSGLIVVWNFFKKHIQIMYGILADKLASKYAMLTARSPKITNLVVLKIKYWSS